MEEAQQAVSKDGFRPPLPVSSDDFGSLIEVQKYKIPLFFASLTVIWRIHRCWSSQECWKQELAERPLFPAILNRLDEIAPLSKKWNEIDPDNYKFGIKKKDEADPYPGDFSFEPGDNNEHSGWNGKPRNTIYIYRSDLCY